MAPPRREGVRRESRPRSPFFHLRRGPTPAANLRRCSASDSLVLGLAWPQALPYLPHLAYQPDLPDFFHLRWGPTPSAN